MASNAAPIALATLRAEMAAAAQGFADYNFREYFTKWTTDRCDSIEKKGPEAVASYEAAEGPADLARMKRMATVNAMYSETKVVVDPKSE